MQYFKDLIKGDVSGATEIYSESEEQKLLRGDWDAKMRTKNIEEALRVEEELNEQGIKTKIIAVDLKGVGLVNTLFYKHSKKVKK